MNWEILEKNFQIATSDYSRYISPAGTSSTAMEIVS